MQISGLKEIVALKETGVDKILTRVPINKTAAIIVSKGENYIPNKKIANIDSDLPIPIKKVPKEAENIIGHKQGRLTVIGFSKDFNGRWVVKCLCGRYTVRSKKALMNPANINDCCEHCRHFNFLKKEQTRKKII